MKTKRFLSIMLGVWIIAGFIPLTALAVETYPLTVNKIPVTSDNAADILGDGTASYDSALNTLSLSDAQINQITYTGDDAFTVSLTGNNSVTSSQSETSPLINCTSELMIKGQGNLTVNCLNKYIQCIYSPKNITVDGSGITLINSSNAGLASNMDIYIVNGANIKGNTGCMLYAINGKVSIKNSSITAPVEGTTVTGWNAVWVKNLEIIQSVVNIDSSSQAVWADGDISIENSDVTVISRSKPADGDSGQPGLISMGSLTIKDSTVNANSVYHIAIYANNNLTISGGSVTAVTTHETASAIRSSKGNILISGPVTINTSTVGGNSYSAQGGIIFKSSAAADDKHYEVYAGTSDSHEKLSSSPFLSNTDITDDINNRPYFKIEGQEHSDESKLNFNETHHWEECPLCHEQRGVMENHTGSDDGDCTTALKCSVCGYKIIEAKENHSFTDYKSNNDATCTSDGTKTAHCDNEGCEKTDTITDTGSALGHKFYNGSCTVCGETASDYKKYEASADSDTIWSKEDDKCISLGFPGEMGEIIKLTINGKELTKGTDYTITDEKVTIKPAILETLANGSHIIFLSGKTGYIETTIFIKEKETTEPTQPTQPVEPVQPTEPTQHVEPVQPTEPTQPVEPVKPTAPAQNTEQNKPNQDISVKNPQTGEKHSHNLLFVMLLISAAGIRVVSMYEKGNKIK